MTANTPALPPGEGPAFAWFSRIVTGIVAAISVIACSLLIFVVVANGLEILLRGLFNHSFSWVYDVNLLLSNWIYFLGMCLVYDRHKDISLDFLRRLASPRMQLRLAIAVNVISAATFIMIGRYTVELVMLQWPFRTSGYGIPQPLYSLPLLIAAVVICLILVRQSIDIVVSGELPRPVHAQVEG
jgi:TRAP-type C4-dicarboxylate transport system permease small subunit